ncbi:MAG TPA: hypothetical protein VK207_03560 [Bacteroidales bacterium]|nr:hypothetical protein [Bacteroidales bacterium]
MKNLIASLISLLVCIGASAQTENLTVPLSKPGEQYTLKVKNFSGLIKITGYDGKDVIINVTPGKDDDAEAEDEDDQKPAAAKGMKRISADHGYEITAKEADNVVTVNTNNIEKVIDLELRIPRNVKLEAGTVNEGEVIIENAEGEFEVNNVNDNVKLTGISGSVVASSIAGDVFVSFQSVKPESTMAFSSLSGNVHVELPATTKARVKMKSDHGEVYSDFDIEVDKTPAKTEKVSQPGMYQIKKDDWIYGKINGGGPEMMFKSLSGDIYLKKSAK